MITCNRKMVTYSSNKVLDRYCKMPRLVESLEVLVTTKVAFLIFVYLASFLNKWDIDSCRIVGLVANNFQFSPDFVCLTRHFLYFE